MIALSAIIITLNEAKNIGRCLDSLKGVADEIVVVDSFSTDKTVAIAKEKGAIVFQKTFDGYGAQKHFAETCASHNWVLSMDADEALSDKLRESILEMKKAPSADAWKLNILTNYCGKWIHHSGWYPQAKIKCWNRLKAASNKDQVHESIDLKSTMVKVGHLKGDMLHYSFNTLSEHLQKIETYTEKGARFDVARGKKCSFLKLLIAPQWKFFQDYFLRLGFLDGYYGFIICMNSAFASFIKYAKIRELQSKASGKKY